jgi:radical SAM superfamily enzyme YgiQ (UPF0313 family)
MNILLVYPQYPDTFWSFKHALKFVAKKAAFPPLGLLTVAAMLPAEWSKRLVDVNVAALKDEDITWAEIVFVSAMLVQQDNAREIIQRCQALDKTIVAGGPAFSAQPELFPGVDHFVLDEAEVTLPPFLEDLRNGRPQAVYTSAEKPDITRTPIPLWSLVNLKNYATMAVQYSRGCPFDCEFCDIVVLNGRVPRTKTPAQMIAEFQALYDAGWRRAIFVVDDNFIGNKVEVKIMLRELIRWQKAHQYPHMLLTEASLNLADDPELMQLMSTANFSKVFLGIETPCLESLRECGKKQNVTRDLAESVKTIHQHGMQVMGGFIIGFDSDTESIFETQIRFIQRIGVATAMVGLLTALPHTRLWHRLKKEGRLVADSCGENTAADLNFIPRMGREKLIRGYQNVVRTIYSPRRYYQRINTFIKSYRPTARGKPSRDDVMALFRSMWRIGVLSRSCLLYWKLLVKTALTKFRALPVAVELAIYGLHFQRCARRERR